MGKNAYVTLATSDEYAIGALVLAQSILNAKTEADIVILVTNGVSPALRDSLSTVFTKVVLVNELVSDNTEILNLINRPELSVTISKIHAWKLTDYEKCVFLDADCLVVKAVDELFEKPELSAVCDIGWPDCFNSGVFVFQPNQTTFNGLLELAKNEGSFDGGDQGLLNVYFNDWLDSDINKRLSFIYNMHSSAAYTYLPAFRKFGERVKIVHFLGAIKPWMYNYDKTTGDITSTFQAQHNMSHVTQWWRVFAHQIKDKLPSDLNKFWLPHSLASFLKEITTFAQPESSTHLKAAVNEQLHKKNENNLNANLDFKATLSARLNDLCLTTSTNFNESNNEQTMTQQIEDKLIESNSDNQSNSDNEQTDDDQIISDNEQNDQLTNDEGGIAGQLANLEVIKRSEEYERKKNWEIGGLVDYLGADSFENIQKKIQESIGKTD